MPIHRFESARLPKLSSAFLNLMLSSSISGSQILMISIGLSTATTVTIAITTWNYVDSRFMEKILVPRI